MRILIISQYFYPDVAAVAQYNTDLAEAIMNAGFQVEVIKGDKPYAEVVNNAYKSAEFSKKIRVHKAHVIKLNNNSALALLLNYFSFHLAALLKSLFIKKCDLVMVVTTPPLIGIIGMFIKYFKGSKFVYVVQDIYPDAAVKEDYLKPKGLFTRFAYYLHQMVLRHADMTITISDLLKNTLIDTGRADPDKIAVISNWADSNELYPLPKSDNVFLSKYDLQGKFIIQYSGRMAAGRDFYPILNAARQLKDNKGIVFMIIGGGIKLDEIKQYVDGEGLTNVMLLPYQDKNILNYSLNAADIALITFEKNLLGLAFPCKIFGIMATGKPIIYIGPAESEIGEIIKAAKNGFINEDNDANKLVSQITELYNNRQMLGQMAENSRKYFLGRYEKRMAVDAYLRIIKEAIK